MERIDWIIIDEENAQDVFADLKEQGIDPVLIGLTDDGYATLSLNNARVRNYIILSNEVIGKYKEYYEGDRGTEQSAE